MKSIITLHATPNAWLTNSVLAPHLGAFIAHLQQGRYAAKTTRGYAAGIAHFAYWITQSKLPVEALDEHTVKQFLNDHLPRCGCPTPVMRYHRDLIDHGSSLKEVTFLALISCQFPGNRRFRYTRQLRYLFLVLPCFL